MSAVSVIKPITKGVTKDVYDTVKESLFKDMKDADLKAVRNYSLLAIGFSVTGYFMYRNRSIIYSSIESRLYSKEDRINRRMNEWEKSNRGTEDHKRFLKALASEICIEGLEGSTDVSKDCLSKVLSFMDKYRESFGYGPDITEIYSFIESIVYTKDDKIHRRMNEWEKSNRGTEDHKRFSKALASEICIEGLEGSTDVSKDCLSKVLSFMDKYRESFGYGPEVTEIYSSIEPRVYSKEDRIDRRMNEWLTSKKLVEDHRRFSYALIEDISKESGLSRDCSINMQSFLISYKQYFGPEITIFDICKCVVNRKDYSHHNWRLLAFMCDIAGLSKNSFIITDPILFSAMDVIHELLKELPIDTPDEVIVCITGVFANVYSRINLGTTHYRLSLRPNVWDRIHLCIKSYPNFDKVCEFYHALQSQNTP